MYRPGRVLLYLLIAAHVAAAAALIVLAFHGDWRTHASNLEIVQRRFAIAAVLGASFAQTALAVWWAVMGRSLTWPTRTAVFVGVCAIWVRVMSVSSEASGVVGWMLYVGMTVAMLWVLVPWRMMADRSLNMSPRWQFELRQLMMLVLAAALTFALLSWFVSAGSMGFVKDTLPFSLSGAATATVACWVCHRRRGRFWRSPAMIAIVATVTLLTWLWQGGRSNLWYIATPVAVEAVTIAATMAVLHVAARQPVGAVPRSEFARESAALRDPQFG